MDLNKKNDYAFLADTKKHSAAYAIQYGFETAKIECWKVVLQRPDVPIDDCLLLAMQLGDKDLTLSILKKDGVPPQKAIDTVAYLHDNDADWEGFFGVESVMQYLESLQIEEILSSYAHIKSELFWKILKDLHPKLKREAFV